MKGAERHRDEARRPRIGRRAAAAPVGVGLNDRDLGANDRSSGLVSYLHQHGPGQDLSVRQPTGEEQAETTDPHAKRVAATAQIVRIPAPRSLVPCK